jgi:hypothetical protein
MSIRCIALIIFLSVVKSWGAIASEFVEAAPMPAATAAHSAIVLSDGNVLVVGGLGQLFGLPIAVNLGRIYNVQEDRWQVLQSQMKYGRIAAGITRLKDGKIIIVGGLSQSLKAMTLIELYDPLTKQFSVLGRMKKARSRPRLNLLLDGRVLISGESKHCELLEPVEDGYRIRMLQAQTYGYHKDHIAQTLADGSVLLIGGHNRTIERFDPQSETFERRSARLPKVLDDMAWALLYDERVLIAGGQQVYTMKSTGGIWLYDPKADQLQEGPALQPSFNAERFDGVADAVAVDLYSTDPKEWGRYILICGGEYDPGKKGLGKDVALNYATIYDARKNRLIDVGPMRHERDEFSGVALPTTQNQAQVLLIGGYRTGDRVQGSCEIFHFHDAGIFHGNP